MCFVIACLFLFVVDVCLFGLCWCVEGFGVFHVLCFPLVFPIDLLFALLGFLWLVVLLCWGVVIEKYPCVLILFCCWWCLFGVVRACSLIAGVVFGCLFAYRLNIALRSNVL